MEKMSRPLPINPTFLPPTHGVLKSLLENPMKLPFHHDEGFGKDKEKEKKLEEDGNALNAPQSAFLGPTLWDKTLPYDGDNFQLEYMDLEEFLLENNIPANPGSEQNQPSQQPLQQQQQQPPSAPPTPSVVDLSNRTATSVHSGIVGQNCLQSPSRAGTDPSLEMTPEMRINSFSLASLSISAQDDRYWVRRRKNNIAAKRSRDARRLKENQIAIRAGFLEKENAVLRQEVADLRKELGRCKNVLAKYEARHGPL
uniref:HLF transcription factor, PAR bZIP family member n=1 Tax=Cyprinus carpio TaxID=7962 RepID=A0A8C2CJF1_CYPCA